MLSAQGHPESLWQNKELESTGHPSALSNISYFSFIHSDKKAEHNNERHASTAYLMYMTGMISS